MTGSLPSRELQLALAPTAMYQRLLTSEPVHGWRVFRHPAIVLLVVAVMVPIAAVQRVTVGLVATAAVSWSFVLVVQAAAAVLVVASAPRRRVTVATALDLWFAGHLPYSLWTLIALTCMATFPVSVELIIASAIVPAIWTMVVVSAFCRTVLLTTPAGARWRTAAHFVAIWGFTFSYIAWVAGGWFQVVPW
jgi:hypothetical protein